MIVATSYAGQLPDGTDIEVCVYTTQNEQSYLHVTVCERHTGREIWQSGDDTHPTTVMLAYDSWIAGLAEAQHDLGGES